MGNVSVIEERLKAINETVFQELCDAYISLKYFKSRAFSRTGSQLGKQKVKKGTPDSFIQLDDGTYLFIESTTQQTGLLKKFKEDISKCLDEEKTSIPKSKLREIILCFNSKADAEAINELTDSVKPIKVRFISIDDLAMQISLHYRTLAKDYLNLPLDSGQIVPLEKFLKHYNENSQSIATPIDNQLFHRETELSSLIDLIQTNDFVVITGPPGIGKTKLAVEAITEFQKRFGYSTFAVLNKDYDLLEDLAYYFDNSSQNILFIDDANRIDRLLQIKGFAEDANSGSLKIVLTVRDYALDQIKTLIPKVSELELTSLSEDQIIDIIKNDPFKITNEEYHPKILSISNNNLRLAIMAARLAIEKNNLNALHEVYDLFDEYFKTFIQDSGLLQDKIIIKTLGLLSYFNTISLANSDALEKTLSKFYLSRTEFIESIRKLETIEIVEVKYNHVKISDQSLSIYFFFKTFFKDDLLSFAVLMEGFYESTRNRIRDTVIPANNTFGYSNIREKIRPVLLFKLNSIQVDKDILSFFELFWFYMEDELLSTVVKKINNSPTNESNYTVNEKSQVAEDQYLKLLFNIILYHHDAKLIENATSLSFEYTKRTPSAYSQLIKSVTDGFSFDYEDEHNLYQRQTMLFDLIESKLLAEEFYKRIFFDIANKFLYFRFQQARPLRGHKFSLYSYTLKETEPIVKFRRKIWELLERLFPTNTEEAFEVVHRYSQQRLDVDIAILQIDFIAIEELIKKYFKPERFDHSYIVQELCGWAKRLKIEGHAIKRHQQNFFTEKYKLFRKIDWNRLRDKEQHEYTIDQKYEIVKEREIRGFFQFSSLQEYESFISTYIEIKRFRKDGYELSNSLAIVLDENIRSNRYLAIEIFKKLVRDRRLDNFSPYLAITTLATLSDVFSDKFWSVIKPFSRLKIWLRKEDTRIAALFDWQLHYLLQLPLSKINAEKYDALIFVIKSIKFSCTLFLEGLEKYENYKPGLIDKILGIVVNHNKKGNIRIALWHGFFDKFKNYFSDIILLKKAYIQQDNIQKLFDYNGDDLLYVLRKDPDFLLEYINSIADDDLGRRSSDYKCFQVVWDLDAPNQIVKKAINHLIENNKLGLNSEFLSSFFVNIKPDNHTKAYEFVLQYISEYFNDTEKMSAIFELLEGKLKHLFQEAFSSYLRLNSNVEDFKKIEWTGNGIVIHNGSANMGDIKAAKWQHILELVIAEDMGIASISITAWLKQQIEFEKRSGDRFREWAYLGE
jgi:DNA polymerase III delta prime subunit